MTTYLLVDTANTFFRARHAAHRAADQWTRLGFGNLGCFTMTSNGRLPLSRFTVLDLTAHRAGPTCVRQLGDWGANVIKIEAPDRINKDKGGIIGARHGFDFQNLSY